MTLEGPRRKLRLAKREEIVKKRVKGKEGCFAKIESNEQKRERKRTNFLAIKKTENNEWTEQEIPIRPAQF